MSRRATLLAVLLQAALSFAAGATERGRDNASCAGCHPDIAAEWTASLHRHAWTDPVFQRAYDVEPLAFCRGCHAPESDAAREPTKIAQEIGIGCVSCHVESGHVVGPRAAPTNALHEVLADANLATPRACARCHEFDFPSSAHQLTAEPMQDTVREHAGSTRAATPCQGCHMPLVDGPEGRHKSHAFSVLADPAMLRRAVMARAERAGARVHVTLSAGDVGHAFPTGDMFRRLEVRAAAVDRAGRVIARAQPVTLGRSFTDVPRDPSGRDLTFMRVESADTRVPAPGQGERAVELTLPGGAASARVTWEVVYQRMSTPMAEAFGVSQVLDEVVVASGELAPPSLSYNSGGRR
jgi:Cytochrome c554 and c-prime